MFFLLVFFFFCFLNLYFFLYFHISIFSLLETGFNNLLWFALSIVSSVSLHYKLKEVVNSLFIPIMFFFNCFLFSKSIYYFPNFIFEHLVYWRLGLIIYHSLLYIWLAKSNNSYYGIDELALFFLSFYNWYFFNFIIQYWVDYELSFMIYFGLFFMRLSRFHDSSREFGGLTQLT